MVANRAILPGEKVGNEVAVVVVLGLDVDVGLASGLVVVVGVRRCTTVKKYEKTGRQSYQTQYVFHAFLLSGRFSLFYLYPIYCWRTSELSLTLAVFYPYD